MSTVTNPSSPLSYTNKDFRALYEELLDLVKKLTYKWDPSISNESDPGVILLKLNAIIGDKNNYNIDKNVLEVFPETLTQELSARTMYHQLAYNMPWYKSGTTTLTFKWTGPDIPVGEQVKIPRFTMVTDSDSKVIFTLTQDVYFDTDTLTTTADAIQGIITDEKVNGESELHLVNMDHNNRVYLSDYSVAENGVFIQNVGENTEWTKVDNLAVTPRGNTYYEFGVDNRNNLCYVEFPDDIETLIKNGLTIKYVISEGRSGNVAAKTITNFYDDITVTLAGEQVNLNADTCLLYNVDAVTNGSDPETIEDAYRSYKRVAGTFDTLVTLRDYINAIYRMENISNVVVADRNTDIQDTYSIVTDAAGSANQMTVVTGSTDDTETPSLTAFDLKLYMLQSPGAISTISDYEKSFEMIASQSEDARYVKLAIEQQKCILHDFQDIETGSPCLFRIVFPLRIKIVPQYKLTDMQQTDVKKNVMSALFNALNAHEVDFGSEPNYDEIYDTIATADERIKLVIIDDFQYTVYATYWTGSEFKHIPVSTFDKDAYIVYCNKKFTEAQTEFQFKVNSVSDPERLYFICKSEDLTSTEIYKYSSRTRTFVPYAVDGELDTFRKQIIAKSILAGVTPLFNQESVFTYTIDQQVDTQQKDVDRITTDLVISPFGFDNLEAKQLPEEAKDRVTSAQYQLKDNETLQFYAPSFVSKRNFSNYVAYQFIKKDSTGQEEISVSLTEYSLWPTAKRQNTRLLAMSEAFEYVDITDYYENTLFYRPIFVPGIYFDDKGAIVTSIPLDWGTNGKYFYDKQHTNPIEFIAPESERYTYKSAWADGLLGVYYRDDVYRIPANTDYKLQPGDSITFFYTEEQETNAPYTYECYRGIANETDIEKSPIIRPSFTLNGVSSADATIKITEALPATGYIPYNSASNSTYMKVYDMFGHNDLSGSQTIDIRAMNEKYIERTNYYYYFITNNIVYDENDIAYYEMQLEPESSSETSNCRYILKTDEYFIYTNKNKTEFEILGPGTLIKFLECPTESRQLKVVLVDYNDIARDGLSAFEAQCILFRNDAILREQQIYNFAANDIISISLQSSYFSDSKYEQYPHFSTTEDTPVQDFEISYSTNGSTFNTLPRIDINDTESVWKGRAILNMDSSSSDAQVINNSLVDNDVKNRQSIQRIKINDISYPSDSQLENSCLLYLLTNISLTKSGGDNIDVTYLNLEGERKNLEVLIYALNPGFSVEPFSYQDGQICMKTSAPGTVPNINLQTGYKYILGITNTSDISKFRIQLFKDGVDFPIKCLNDSTITEFDSSHTWYFSFEGQQNLTLKITPTTYDSGGYLLFDSLLKYTDNNVFESNYGITASDILSHIHEYKDSDKFKYNYIVDDTTKIIDPLDAKSFFKTNHIFNSYSIPKAQLRMTNSSELDSSIAIVNNR